MSDLTLKPFHGFQSRTSFLRMDQRTAPLQKKCSCIGVFASSDSSNLQIRKKMLNTIIRPQDICSFTPSLTISHPSTQRTWPGVVWRSKAWPGLQVPLLLRAAAARTVWECLNDLNSKRGSNALKPAKHGSVWPFGPWWFDTCGGIWLW